MVLFHKLYGGVWPRPIIAEYCLNFSLGYGWSFVLGLARLGLVWCYAYGQGNFRVRVRIKVRLTLDPKLTVPMIVNGFLCVKK